MAGPSSELAPGAWSMLLKLETGALGANCKPAGAVELLDGRHERWQE